MQADPSQAAAPAVINEEIAQWNTVEPPRRIHARDVSCMEVIEASLAQIDRRSSAVNIVVARIDAESVIDQARERGVLPSRDLSDGWVHGFPQAPKDLTAIAGMVTAMGDLAMAYNVSMHDNIIVEHIRRQGTVLIGETNTSEFGFGSYIYNRVYGTMCNAWNPECSTGGSSGGTAAAPALSMLPVVDSSDMTGSLRNPAAWNNIYGLHPNLGRVPHGSAGDVFFQQLSTEGPMARNPQDLAWLLATQADYDPRAPPSLNDDPACFMQPLYRDLRQARIGWLGDFGGYLAIDAEMLAVNERVLDTFDTLGYHVEIVRPFFAMDTLWERQCTLRALSVSGNLGLLCTNAATRDLLRPGAIWEIEHKRSHAAIDISRAIAAQASWYQVLLWQFAHYDFLVLPYT